MPSFGSLGFPAARDDDPLEPDPSDEVDEVAFDGDPVSVRALVPALTGVPLVTFLSLFGAMAVDADRKNSAAPLRQNSPNNRRKTPELSMALKTSPMGLMALETLKSCSRRSRQHVCVEFGSSEE